MDRALALAARFSGSRRVPQVVAVRRRRKMGYSKLIHAGANKTPFLSDIAWPSPLRPFDRLDYSIQEVPLAAMKACSARSFALSPGRRDRAAFCECKIRQEASRLIRRTLYLQTHDSMSITLASVN